MAPSPQPLWVAPIAFYLLVLALIRGDLAQASLAPGDLSLHFYFGALILYCGGMLAFFAYFA